VNLRRPSLGFAVIAALIVAMVLTALGAISQQALDYAFLCSVAWALFNAMRKASLGPLSAAALATGIAGSLVGLQVWQPSLHYMPYLVIAPANLAMAYYFVRGLFPGRQPVLLQLIRAMGKGPDDDPGFRHFVVWQCALWGLMTFATACLAFVVMVSVSVVAWVSSALTTLILVQIAWFVLSHYYAGLRYNRPETWYNTLVAMTRPGIWSSLGA
jgi:hypothetical protein